MTEVNVAVGPSFETRSAALLVQTAGKFASRVLLRLGEKTANAKSVMGVISLGMADGQTLSIVADGSDERQAVQALLPFFGE